MRAEARHDPAAPGHFGCAPVQVKTRWAELSDPEKQEVTRLAYQHLQDGGSRSFSTISILHLQLLFMFPSRYFVTQDCH